MKFNKKRSLILVIFSLSFILLALKNNSNPPKLKENSTLYYDQNINYDAKVLSLSEVRDLADEWDRVWGDELTDRIYDLAMDSHNNIYITGVHYVSGESDVILLKYDSEGNLLWDIVYETGSYYGIALAIDSDDNVTLVATTASYDSYKFFKYNSSGILQWMQTYSYEDYIKIIDIVLDLSDNIYTSGASGVDGDALVIKYNCAGEYQWNFTWGGPASDSAQTIAVDSLNNIYIAGSTANWLTGGGSSDGVIAKFDSSKSLEWNHTFGLETSDIFLDIKLNSTGYIYVAGYRWGQGTKGYVVCYDPSGNYLWNHTENGRSYEKLTLDSSENIFISGDGGGVFFAKYNMGGQQLWNYTWNGGSHGLGIGLDVKDNVYIGYRKGGIDENIGLIKFSSKPKISIIEPTPDLLCGKAAPCYNITIYEPDLNKSWYTLDNGKVNITFSKLNDTINQIAWDNANLGDITLIFYANDTMGNLGFNQVEIIKWFTEDGQGNGEGGGGGGGGNNRENELGGIPGYDLFFSLGLIWLSIILLAHHSLKKLKR